jgi:hypothetical protein
MSKQNEYEVESSNNAEYVVVRCPKGHRMRGMKVGEMKVRQQFACPECESVWTMVAPLTNGMEVCA